MKTNCKFLQNIFPVVIVYSIILSSCHSYLDIEKRRYRGGYYVKRNFFHHTSDKKQREETSSLEFDDLNFILSDSFLLAQVKSDSAELEIISAKTFPVISKYYNRATHHSFQGVSPQEEKLRKKNVWKKYAQKKDVSPVLGALAILAIACILFWSFHWVALSLFVAAIGTAVLIYAIHLIKKYPEKYGGKGIALAVLVLVGLIALLSLFAFIFILTVM